MMHNCHHLVTVFDACFSGSENTRLLAGGAEPEYLPADAEHPQHRIIFTRDYFASALHEIAHWCVAGAERRTLPDYGYWYAPDGRSAGQQAEFERVEVAPQALEWLFSCAAGSKFRVSADNLSQGLGASESFKDAIHARALWHCAHGVNPRTGAFLKALIATYHTADSLAELLQPERFPREHL
ncbi:elongation factor P hydroxylase [Marinimicrobium alkaliphilum]|uniref:elongation factor P hydroxylase n=1 Tax=Marinimicrobium alkaliphilum TaxID=2202654 RepID=UPI000DBA5EFC|nr:elongation factor P hydroxylase [Marinimicrobium alkaliphilum]